jgi:hypothetical protein
MVVERVTVIGTVKFLSLASNEHYNPQVLMYAGKIQMNAYGLEAVRERHLNDPVKKSGAS